MFLHILDRIAFLMVEFPTNLPNVLWPLIAYLIKQFLFATKQMKLYHQCQGNDSFHRCQLHHGCKPITKLTNVMGLRSFLW